MVHFDSPNLGVCFWMPRDCRPYYYRMDEKVFDLGRSELTWKIERWSVKPNPPSKTKFKKGLLIK